jgi:hypothetical protein
MLRDPLDRINWFAARSFRPVDLDRVADGIPWQVMALVRCPDCGRDVSDAAVACPGCGRPMTPPMVQAPPMQMMPAQAAQGRKQGSMVWVVILLIVGVVGLLVVVGFLLNGAAKLKAETREARTQCNAIRSAMILYQDSHPRGACPTVVQLKTDGDLDPSFSATDPWGSSFKTQCTRENDVVCSSPGPDRTWGTSDDMREPPPAGK